MSGFAIEQSRPMVMGILNVTPDSFSDGGQYVSKDAILCQVEKMVEAGADWIDIGGESTRPGAKSVALQVELDRVLPAIEWVKSVCDLPISVDTYKPQVMAESIALGVDMINDINALQSKGAIEVVADADIKVCLMHKRGAVNTMQQAPQYENVVEEVVVFLMNRVDVCLDLGILRENILIDPGFGFGKTLEHNVALFKSLSAFVALDYPVLVGVSRKKMIGELLNTVVEDRMIGSVAASMVAMQQGVEFLRVHDVAETVQALKVIQALS